MPNWPVTNQRISQVLTKEIDTARKIKLRTELPSRRFAETDLYPLSKNVPRAR